jgi:16S rRNA (adenine1518-N6/adenine1519-N6)-dimethyltransferase
MKAKKSLGLETFKFARAKKALGQNFLKSEQALRKIIETGEITKGNTVLEIGPGKGALTAKLLDSAGQVVAVEKDRELVEYLKGKFAEQIKDGSLVLISGDILDFKPESLQKYKIIANIPYNITGAVLKKFLTAINQPERMVLLVQKEVAQRIVAQDGRESILSISVKAYAEPKMIMKVPARYFSPAPKVDSAVILIKNISRRAFEENYLEEEKFWTIVRAGFAHKRKKLSSNLKNLALEIPVPNIEKLGNTRAEELSLKEWITLLKN